MAGGAGAHLLIGRLGFPAAHISNPGSGHALYLIEHVLRMQKHRHRTLPVPFSSLSRNFTAFIVGDRRRIAMAPAIFGTL